MDKQLIFFLILAFSFFLFGTFSMNFIMQFSGIILLLFLIYDHLFNKEANKKYEKNYRKGPNMIGFLGHIDLILGVLLLIYGLHGIVPVSLLIVLAILLSLKALPFVFGGDAASVLDVLSAIIIFSLVSVEIPEFVLLGMSVYLIQKGLLSYLG